MKNLFSLFLTLFFIQCTRAHVPESTVKNQDENPPKLIVGIVVDQMRYDLLHRFRNKFGEGGFNRLLSEGFSCEFNHYHYASTVTGPGHAHVYTGSLPAISGIVGNNWFDKIEKKGKYVVQDDDVVAIGADGDTEGKMSPRNLKVTTISDQIRINSQFKGKVVGVAIKDRGAILPAGHTGKAFWYSSKNEKWISSSFYFEKLPNWVDTFNAKNLALEFSKMGWNTFYDSVEYQETEEDDQPYENKLGLEEKAVFPHKFSSSGIATTPFGNTMTLEFALAALEHEELGKDAITDLLAISFSSPDYVGHAFGPQSKEIEDTYIRLDRDMENLLNTLDEKVGKNEYMVFLTADHGVAEIPAFLRKHHVPAGVFVSSEILNPLNRALSVKFGEGKWVLAEENYQLYLNLELLEEKGVHKTQILVETKKFFLPKEGVLDVIDLENVQQATLPNAYKELLSNIYNQKRSGELMILMEPGWFIGWTKGTTHGTMYAYDTHVPLLFYGKDIPHGSTSRPTYIKDIAPTIAQYLRILEPSGSIGTPIFEILRK